jgi:hypothetical protein
LIIVFINEKFPADLTLEGPEDRVVKSLCFCHENGHDAREPHPYRIKIPEGSSEEILRSADD